MNQSMHPGAIVPRALAAEDSPAPRDSTGSSVQALQAPLTNAETQGSCDEDAVGP